MKKYFVVSLPRTGTRSMCEMASLVGYKADHVSDKRFNTGNFFADTPSFCPSVVRTLVENENNYFIYVDRDLKELADSWVRKDIINTYNKHYQFKYDFDHIWSLDRESYWEIMGAKPQISYEDLVPQFKAHKEIILELLPEDRMLLYKFSDGWEPFCKFLDVKVPDAKIPHIISF